MVSLEAEVFRFEAGRIQQYAEAWARITSDPDVLGVVWCQVQRSYLTATLIACRGCLCLVQI